MLLLDRRAGQQIILELPDGSEVRITLTGIDRRGNVRLAFDAAQAVPIWREEKSAHAARP